VEQLVQSGTDNTTSNCPALLVAAVGIGNELRLTADIADAI
jgi:hypothetical protein